MNLHHYPTDYVHIVILLESGNELSPLLTDLNDDQLLLVAYEQFAV